jgi:hypothetical protein
MHEPLTHMPEQHDASLLHSRPDWRHVEQTLLTQASSPQQSLVMVHDWPVAWQLAGTHEPPAQLIEQHAASLPQDMPRPWHAPA